MKLFVKVQTMTLPVKQMSGDSAKDHIVSLVSVGEG